jgi:hypothetical protein
MEEDGKLSQEMTREMEKQTPSARALRHLADTLLWDVRTIYPTYL